MVVVRSKEERGFTLECQEATCNWNPAWAEFDSFRSISRAASLHCEYTGHSVQVIDTQRYWFREEAE